MSELLRQIEEAGAHVQVQWSAERVRSNERVLVRRRLQRARVRAGLLAATALVVVLAVGFGLKLWSTATGPLPQERVAGVASSPPSYQELRFDDGSVATGFDAASRLRSRLRSQSRVELEVEEGGAMFDVTPNPTRAFVVRAGNVSVRVLGTRFSVAHRADHVAVVVERGRVHVAWPGGATELQAGQRQDFPEDVGEPKAAVTEPDAGTPEVPEVSTKEGAAHRTDAPPRAAASVESRAPSWRALARQGDYAEAYDAMRAEGDIAVGEQAEDLMLAADVARLSGHSGKAVAPLRQMLASHRGDPRAPLAAFTLGRVLLDELGRPGEAAVAFADSRRLAPGGALSQDALAREVEALSKAGQSVAARERALQYVRQYPDGRRLKAVRRYGGLE